MEFRPRRASRWADHRGTTRFRTASQLPHDQLEEQQRGFGRLLILGEVAKDAALLFAAEGRIGQDHIDAVSLADLRQLEAK